jgi:urease accessory protein
VVEIARPAGPVLCLDATILDPLDGLRAAGRLGAYAASGALYVIHAGFDPQLLRDAIGDAAGPDLMAGASSLPSDLGAWLKVLGPDGRAVSALLGRAAAAAHWAILGSPPPSSRRP